MDDLLEVKFCSNCKHEVPAANYMMHHIHCQRKLAFCQKCNEPIPLSEFDIHNVNLHSLTDCPSCGQQMEKILLAEHQRSACSHRSVCCRFCHIEVEALELPDHENYCGSRTERCECGEFVMLKYQQLHEDTNHGFLKLEDEPGPTPLWSASRTTSNVLNDLSRQRKVSNASQDTSRPTSALNRLSPSKRTNDMPQVNSAATASKPKAIHKAQIHQESRNDDDSVDLDLLLALRLEEQEKKRAAAGGLSAPPARDIHETEDLGGELVALPCEFCEAMIPANQLVKHETGCRPDLAQFIPRTPKSKNTPEPGEEGLPCEFCGELFAPHHLLQHEGSCEVSAALQESMHMNRFSLSPSASRVTKKIVNMEPTSSLLLPRRLSDNNDSSDRNPYLSEVRAALRKPTANVTPLSSHQSSSFDYSGPGPSGLGRLNMSPSCVNGYTRHAASTGAVPKQKAVKHSSNIREVSKEVPRSSSSTVTTSTYRPGLDGSSSSR